MNFCKSCSFFLCLIFLVACQKDPATLAIDPLPYLPEEVSVVGVLTTERLLAASRDEQLQATDCFQKMLRRTQGQNPVLSALLRAPDQAGIHLNQNIYFTYSIDPQNINRGFSALTLSVKTSQAFAEMVQQAGFGTIESKTNYQYALRANTIVAWNEQLAVIGGANQKMDLTTEVEKILHSDGQSPIANHPDLQACLSQKSDIVIWMNSHALAKSQEVKSILGLAGLDPKLLNDNYLHHYLDFADGQMEGRTNYRLQEELQLLLSQFFKDQLDTDLVNDLPGTTTSVLGMALDLSGWEAFFGSNLQLSMVASFALKSYGLSLSDLPQIFAGDLLLAQYTQKGKSPYLLTTKLKDVDRFQVLLDGLEAKGLVRPMAGGYEVPIFRRGFSLGTFRIPAGNNWLFIKDQQILFSNQLELLQQAIEGTSTDKRQGASASFSPFRESVFGFVFDFETLAEQDTRKASAFRQLFISSNQETATYRLQQLNTQQNSAYHLCDLLNAF
ncbi:MAG: DUF4836 family protein [Bacteroidota bacterium]